MKATPPPLPMGLGLCMSEKLGGVRELRVEGKVSGESQVSESARTSIFSSAMNSCKNGRFVDVSSDGGSRADVEMSELNSRSDRTRVEFNVTREQEQKGRKEGHG